MADIVALSGAVYEDVGRTSSIPLASIVKLSSHIAQFTEFTVAVAYTEYRFHTSNPFAREASIETRYTHVESEDTGGIYARFTPFSVTRTIGVLSAFARAPVSALFVENVIS